MSQQPVDLMAALRASIEQARREREGRTLATTNPLKPGDRVTVASSAQVGFMKAILKHGGYRIPGSKVFGEREYPVVHRASTIESCKRRGWVLRDESADGRVALWTVTSDGLAAMEIR